MPEVQLQGQYLSLELRDREGKQSQRKIARLKESVSPHTMVPSGHAVFSSGVRLWGPGLSNNCS